MFLEKQMSNNGIEHGCWCSALDDGVVDFRAHLISNEKCCSIVLSRTLFAHTINVAESKWYNFRYRSISIAKMLPCKWVIHIGLRFVSLFCKWHTTSQRALHQQWQFSPSSNPPAPTFSSHCIEVIIAND